MFRCMDASVIIFTALEVIISVPRKVKRSEAYLNAYEFGNQDILYYVTKYGLMEHGEVLSFV